MLKVCEKLVPKFTKKNRKFEMRLPEKHKLPMFLNLNRDEKEKFSNMPRNTYMNFRLSLSVSTSMILLYPSWLKKDMKPEDEQHEATVEGMYREYRLKKYAQAQSING